jgi:biopolymer transport protein ExbB/TolQ
MIGFIVQFLQKKAIMLILSIVILPLLTVGVYKFYTQYKYIKKLEQDLINCQRKQMELQAQILELENKSNHYLRLYNVTLKKLQKQIRRFDNISQNYVIEIPKDEDRCKRIEVQLQKFKEIELKLQNEMEEARNE